MTRLVYVVGLVLALAISGIDGEPSSSKTEWKQCNGAWCVCYDDLGCFEAREECGEKPKDKEEACEQLPQTPADIAITFLLYDKENEDLATELIKPTLKLLTAKKFDTTKDTKILIHGMMSPNYYGLLEHIKEKLHDKFNVIMVNWVSSHDVGTVSRKKIIETYRKSSQNARVVGRKLGLFLQYLQSINALEFANLHIIGHNMGAHIAGYAGKYIFSEEKMKIARITALAPSGPYFEVDGKLKPASCRLHMDDAAFVDAIHPDVPGRTANTIALGIDSQIGHFDSYPNDGKAPQPGCKHMFCSHGRSMELFELSIDGGCTFETEPCTWASNNPPCPAAGCPIMGYGVPTNARGFYCVKTVDVSPFGCKLVSGKAPAKGAPAKGAPANGAPAKSQVV